MRSRHSTACSKKLWTIPSLHLVSCLRSQRYTPQGQVRDRRVHENVGVSRPAFDAEMCAWEEAQAAEQKVSLAVLWTSIPLHRALIFRTSRMYPHSHQGQAASAGVAGGNQFAVSPLGLALAKGQAKSIAHGVKRGDPVATQQLGTVCVQARAGKEALQKTCNENAKLREALEDAKVAVAMHPVAGMDAALQQNHQALITELVGDGFQDARTLRVTFTIG